MLFRSNLRAVAHIYYLEDAKELMRAGVDGFAHGVRDKDIDDEFMNQLRQRRVFERLGLDEAMFFADATSMTLESLRQGAKWAHRARAPLSEALAG